jgi:hypothetical protein
MIMPDFAVAVFPFLKTSAPVQIGGYLFRSTEDREGLPPSQAKAVGEISQMLFVQDNLLVKSASYAIIPELEVHSADPRLAKLAHLRDVVAYFYAAPHEVFGDVFLAPEEVSLALFSPSSVNVFLTRPTHHTRSTESALGSEPDQLRRVPGYNGLYNFRHSFWVEPGSRLYGPKPHMNPVIAQDLASDLEHQMTGHPSYDLVRGLLEKPTTPASLRILSALYWFNAANESGLGQSKALLNLAVAFETLLRLPENSKTDRLVDAISLMLGRTERTDHWATQFYAARSRVAHEGQVGDSYFYARDTGKRQASDIFGSLMLYGRQIFQLCVGTVLVGMELADRANLRERFTTNNERYQEICNILTARVGMASERVLRLEPIVRALERYHFVASEMDTGLMLTAARLAAVALAECGQRLPDDLVSALAGVASSKREDGDIRRLAAIELLYGVYEKQELSALTPEARMVHDIIKLVWLSLFQQYFWLKSQQDKGSASEIS